MATDAEALAAGFLMPQDGDQIKNGDDAIRHNARTALDLTRAATWNHRRLLLTTDRLLSLPVGIYGVASGATATALGLPSERVGSLTIKPASNTSKTFTFETNEINAAFPVEVWQAATNNAGDVLGPWRRLTDRETRGVATELNIDEWFDSKYNGAWVINPAGVTEAGSTNPTAYAYELTHSTTPRSITTQTARSTHVNDGNVYYRAETGTGSKVFQPWKRLLTTKDLTPGNPTAGTASTAGLGHSLHKEDLRAYRGGAVNTGTAKPVALTFDDYPKAFRDVVLPLLRARNLPCTLGLGAGMYEPTSTAIYDGAAGTTWAEIDKWTTADRVEIAHHGRTHGSATTEAALQREIVDGLAELQERLPSRPIHTWMQPSVTYDAGFNNGDSINAYAQTIAGRMILENHGYATGIRKPNGTNIVPLTGHGAPQGIGRNWFDASSGIAGCKTLITGAPAGHGLIIAAHANRFGMGGTYATVAELTGLLDWLAAEQTAGRIKVLTLSEWSIANASR